MNNQAQIISKEQVAESSVANIQQSKGFVLKINSFAEAEAFATQLSKSMFVPKHLRNKPADCLAVVLQSQRWEMDAFSVAQKTYFINEGIGYEAQLINAVIIANAPIKARPDLEWAGEGESLTCKVSATFIGEEKPKVFTAKIKTITTRNSPNWKQQPEIQLGYYALRAWSRLYCPDVIMGVYSDEERREMKDITPSDTLQPIFVSKADAMAAKYAQPEPINHDDDGVVIEQTAEPLIVAPPPAQAQSPQPTIDEREQKAQTKTDELLTVIEMISDFSHITNFIEQNNVALKWLNDNYLTKNQAIMSALQAKENELKAQPAGNVANDDDVRCDETEDMFATTQPQSATHN
jgi:hypothetical protein